MNYEQAVDWYGKQSKEIKDKILDEIFKTGKKADTQVFIDAVEKCQRELWGPWIIC